MAQRFRPSICVNVSYSSDNYPAYDDELSKLAAKFSCDKPHAGSGYGFGERDVDFIFYNLDNASRFARAALRRKPVLSVRSHVETHEGDQLG